MGYINLAKDLVAPDRSASHARGAGRDAAGEPGCDLQNGESQYDMYISTLRRVLEAMGARLKIIAEFPRGQIVISQFHQKARGKARA